MDEKKIQHDYVMEFLCRQEEQGSLGYRNESNIVVKTLLDAQNVAIYINGHKPITTEVYLNYELEQQILSFGEKVKVLEPVELKERIKQRLGGAILNYVEKVQKG